ncbi:MAG: hypothetical protein UZ22_OP11002000812 [Microgenomates bacterium OLB23]|nr:MAG: hypothetical protein UZ22_OP11002000812 [Microgenomates bacterium OLB23]
MGEARNVIIAFLILLFVIIGLGVVFSRMSKDKADKPILGGVLDNIFFSKSLKTTPSPTPTPGTGATTITVRNNAITPTPSSQYTGNNPNSIPATGTPTVVLVLSGAGLASGFVLKKTLAQLIFIEFREGQESEQ